MKRAETTDDMHESIAAGTGVGAVHLSVTNPERSLRFYREILGLEQIGGDDGTLHLGAAGRELVVLHAGASRPAAPRTTGLYHFAIVVPSRRELARVIARLMARRYENYPTDHVMTKADYLSDPDGNGIEVYAETPEDGEWIIDSEDFWARDKDGNRRSGRDPIDLELLFGELREGDRLDVPMPEGTKMGHVHLHVRDVDEAVHFWSDLVGFDVMGVGKRFGMAFVSAGGYHHHLGLNTWAGQGAPPRPPGAAGLRHFTIEVPTAADLDEVRKRLHDGGVDIVDLGAGFAAEDPSHNRAHFVAVEPPPTAS